VDFGRLWTRSRGALAVLVLLGGCATPAAPPVEVSRPKASLFVLLPDEAGSVGSITVSNTAGAQELNQPGQVVRVSGAGAAPSPPFVPGGAEVTRLFGEAIAAQPPPPARFVLYFRGDSDQLTPDSEALLPNVARSIAERRPSDVSIVGHTDTVGTRDYNVRLGLRRAERVRTSLNDLGAQWSTLSLESHGKGNPLVPTADGMAEPRNRRVEIIVR
jgi:outer membrane protein OmpA-like peptidoglycan-associated protein